MSGKKKVTIPWAKLCEDPSLWIMPDCVPDGFQWADPSKIRIGDVFHLLEHWRKRKEDHLEPLIWVSSCPLLEDVDPSEHHGGQQQNSESSSNSDTDTDSSSDHGTHPNSKDRSHSFSEHRESDGSNVGSPLMRTSVSPHESSAGMFNQFSEYMKSC